jgi:hypothetical protein
VDNAAHFTKECPVAQRANKYLLECWDRWLPHDPGPRQWLEHELAPKQEPRRPRDRRQRDRDGGEDGALDENPQRVFMATWAIMVHALYRARTAASAGRSALVGRRVLDDDRAPPCYFPALEAIQIWKAELRSLLQAYAPCDMNNPYERRGIPRWRAQFALHQWYKQRSAVEYDAKVVITFADEGPYVSADLDAEDAEASPMLD